MASVLPSEYPAIPRQKPDSVLKTRFLSHGTLGSRDIHKTREFYEDFLGLEVIQTSPISLMIKLGGFHVYGVVQLNKSAPEQTMPHINHNGLDVGSKSEVDRSHEIVTEQAEKWGISRVSRPTLQHGTYSFYFWDLDGNCWEILSNPPGGYSFIFEQGDLEGKGHLDRNFARPNMDR